MSKVMQLKYEVNPTDYVAVEVDIDAKTATIKYLQGSTEVTNQVGDVSTVVDSTLSTDIQGKVSKTQDLWKLRLYKTDGTTDVNAYVELTAPSDFEIQNVIWESVGTEDLTLKSYITQGTINTTDPKGLGDVYEPQQPSGLAWNEANTNETTPKTYLAMTWDDNPESDLAGYNLYYAVSDSTGTLVWHRANAELLPTSQMNVYGLKAGDYPFAVEAIDTSGNISDQSSTVNLTQSVDSFPAPPPHITHDADGSATGKCAIYWENMSVDGYNIYVSRDKGQTFTKDNADLYPDNLYNISGTSGETLYFYVTSVVGTTESIISPVQEGYVK